MSDLQVLPEYLTLDALLSALGSAVVALRAAPAGTDLAVRSVSLLDADDLAAVEPGATGADLCVLAGVASDVATAWIEQWAAQDRVVRPVLVVTKDVSPALVQAATAVGLAVGALHAQARAELVFSTVRSLLEGAAARPAGDETGEPYVEESDLYGLAQRIAALTGGLVSIEDEQARLLAYSATHGAADELRMLSILGREGPVEHLRRLRELGVYDRLRRDTAVVEVPEDPGLGWRRRLVVSIWPLGVGARRVGHPLGTIWVQEGFEPLAADADSVLEGAAAVAARLIHRTRSAPTQEAQQIQRLFGVRTGGVDVPSLVAALALPASGPCAVIGIRLVEEPGTSLAIITDIAAALRLLAGAYVRESLVTTTEERLYVLVPSGRPAGLARWVAGVLDRLTARFGPQLRAAIAAPVARLADVPEARSEVDRVLDRPAGVDRVTTLTQSRTPVLLGEIVDLVRAREELIDPRLQTLIDYDRDHGAALVETLEHYLRRFGSVRSAASDLHIHPNTLRYRVRRAEEIVGLSVDDPDARLLLQIQLLARSRG